MGGRGPRLPMGGLGRGHALRVDRPRDAQRPARPVRCDRPGRGRGRAACRADRLQSAPVCRIRQSVRRNPRCGAFPRQAVGPARAGDRGLWLESPAALHLEPRRMGIEPADLHATLSRGAAILDQPGRGGTDVPRLLSAEPDRHVRAWLSAAHRVRARRPPRGDGSGDCRVVRADPVDDGLVRADGPPGQRAAPCAPPRDPDQLLSEAVSVLRARGHWTGVSLRARVRDLHGIQVPDRRRIRGGNSRHQRAARVRAGRIGRAADRAAH